ncbi:Coenzyme A ligase [Olavius algarvensis Delta 1 endosymbiont]|nr:Coenzyme A ligase [Olavius algarvensis Delta 1 endosymbiont]
MNPINTEKKYWNPAIETLPAAEMQTLQWRRLKQQLQYNYDHSEFYREEKFHKAKLRPQNIHSFEDFQKIPLMTKDEHRWTQEESLRRFGHPYGMLACAPIDKIIRINSTSGTTGQPTLYTLTKNDVDVLNEMHARKYWRTGLRPGNIVLQALSLSMFTGGLPLSDGLQAMGLCVVPVGIEGGTKRVLDFTLLTRPDVLIATPSFGEYLIEQTPRLIGREARELGIRWFYCAGEPGAGIPSLRKKLQEGFGAKVFDHTGGGHAFHGISCDSEPYPGMHFISPDHCVLELVDPETKAPVTINDGAIGEMVFTFVGWEGGPFMRYALGDLIQLFTEPCACGWPEMRFKILGRADDMLIIKGVNIYPAAIKSVVGEFVPATTGALRIILNGPGPLVTPPLKLRIEYGREDMTAGQKHDLAQEITDRLRNSLRFNPQIELVPPQSLPREAGKTSLIEICKKV